MGEEKGGLKKKWRDGEEGGGTNIIHQENIRIVFARDRVDFMRSYDPCIVPFTRDTIALCHCRLISPVTDIIWSRRHALCSTLICFFFFFSTKKISFRGKAKWGGVLFGGEGGPPGGGGGQEGGREG